MHYGSTDSEDVTSLSPKSGSMNCLGLHRYGLFAAGEVGLNIYVKLKLFLERWWV